MDGNAQVGDQHGPKVEAALPLKGREDEDEDLDAVVAGQGEEAADDHGHRQRYKVEYRTRLARHDGHRK